MTWLNSIYELSYYHAQAQIPCYCDLLVAPSDLAMQHVLYTPVTGNSILIECYSADGLTNYGDVTNYFTTTYGKNQSNNTYFQIKLNTFAPPMCEHLCWILKVTITFNGNTIFEKWTDRFCNVACCSTVRTVTILDDSGTTTTHDIDPAPAWADCNIPVIRIETWNDCYDSFTGEYYAQGFRKITNIRGRFIRMPRAIEKTISVNCKVQKVKSARVYALEAWDYYPEWKMDEIELQLQSQHILINGKEMVYAGGTPFSKPDICQTIYTLKTEFKECDKWQIFGCAPCNTLEGANAYFRISSESGILYDEDRRPIGDTPDELVSYFRSLDGVRDVQILMPDVECDYGFVIYVAGDGYLPSYLYGGGTLARNKIYSVGDVSDICRNVPAFTCAAPIVSSVTLTTLTCEAPIVTNVELTRQVLIPYNFDVTITTDGNSFSDVRMDGYEVIAIITDAQSYNSVFFTKPLNSDTLVSTLDIDGNPRLTFYVGQVVTVIIQ